ncbi:hypothetical protein [Burkholderia pyrrocinia]|uniref:hypothetical protein n=1 Tax=Burkholderia pyrrocinia TaxID=60550 RepID=UPI00158A617D|nr:hypothetical protein [Burkholderia pyrrocinia]
MPRYLWALLIATAFGCGYVYWEDQVDNQVTESQAIATQRQRPANEQTAVSEPAAHQDSIANTTETENIAAPNLFSVRSWAPPRPPAKPVRAPPPKAPPPPFVVTGQWRFKGEQNIVMLQSGNDQYVLCHKCDVQNSVSPGQVFAGSYRLENLTAREIKVTYLPLGEHQTIKIASSN